MEISEFGLLGTRVFQLIFAVVVLGLSASLANWLGYYQDLCNEFSSQDDCSFNGIVPAIRYCAFVGAWGLIDVLIGIAAIFASALPYLVTLVVSALATLFYLAGAIRMTVIMSNTICPSSESKCTQLRADTGFLWLGFIAGLAALALGFFARGRSSGGVSHV